MKIVPNHHVTLRKTIEAVWYGSAKPEAFLSPTPPQYKTMPIQDKPMSIKDTIRAMNDGERLFSERLTESNQVQFYPFKTDDLKALADSHDDLLLKAKAVTETYHCDSFEFAGNGPLNDLIDAIAEAGKL